MTGRYGYSTVGEEMPELNEVRMGRELGYKALSSRYIWQSCADCGKTRWVQVSHDKPYAFRCPKCGNRGARSSFWKGGKPVKDDNGYILIKLYPEDFFYPMAGRNGYVLEHRLVMASHLGRCLHFWEIVHHKNGIKKDNHIGNLQLNLDIGHKQITLFERRIKQLEERILVLEIENALLQEVVCVFHSRLVSGQD